MIATIGEESTDFQTANKNKSRKFVCEFQETHIQKTKEPVWWNLKAHVAINMYGRKFRRLLKQKSSLSYS